MNWYGIWYFLKSLESSNVVYFNQCLGTAHTKHWSKYDFSTFDMQIAEKRKKNVKKLGRMFFVLAPKRWSRVVDYSYQKSKFYQRTFKV